MVRSNLTAYNTRGQKVAEEYIDAVLVPIIVRPIENGTCEIQQAFVLSFHHESYSLLNGINVPNVKLDDIQAY